MTKYWAQYITGQRLLDPLPEETVTRDQVEPREALRHFVKIESIALAHECSNSLIFATVTLDNTKYGMFDKFQKWTLLITAIGDYRKSLQEGYWYAGWIEYTKQHVPHFHFVTNEKCFSKFKDAFGHLGTNNKKNSKWNFDEIKDLVQTWNYISKDNGQFCTNIYKNYFVYDNIEINA